MNKWLMKVKVSNFRLISGKKKCLSNLIIFRVRYVSSDISHSLRAKVDLKEVYLTAQRASHTNQLISA